MLAEQQQQLVVAVEELDLEQVQQLLTHTDPNFMADDVPLVSILTDRLYDWWEKIHDAYEDHQPLSEQEKQANARVYVDILDALILAGANIHLWDSEEFYGPLWDSASAACVPMVQRLLAEKVNPNTLDDEGMTILSSISYLFFECDYDEIDWQDVYPEIKNTLNLLREHGAKMTKELDAPTHLTS